MIYKRYVEGEEYEDWYLDPYRVYFWLTMAVLIAGAIVLLAWPDRVALFLQEVATRAMRAQFGW